MASNKNAAALAVAANTAPAPASNEDAMREAYFGRCTTWGEKAGAGDTSKVGWILDTAQTAWDPNSPIGKGDKAAKRAEGTTAYERYRTARIAKAGEAGKKIATDDDRSRANRISEVIKYIEVGALPLIHDGGPDNLGGYGTLKRTQKIIVTRDDVKGEVEDLLSKVATKQKGSPDKVLTDDEIIEVLCPAAKAEPSAEEKEAALWANVRTQCDSIMKKFPDSAGTSSDAKTARACADSRVRDLGGTRTEKLKQEAAAEKERLAKIKAANKKVKRK